MGHGPDDFPRVLYTFRRNPHQVTERVGPVGPVLQQIAAAIIIAICQTNVMDALLHEGVAAQKR
eukprot:11173776-Lingulodinium_polyedra.AAC.1